MRLSGRIAALTATALLPVVSGCADLSRGLALSSRQIDQRSVVAPQVQAAADRNYPYPTFRDIPAKPTDVRSAEAFKAGVVGQIGARREVKNWAAGNPALQQGDTEAFAATGRAAISPEAIKPLSAPDTEAYAAKVRAEGAAPPPPK